MTDLPKDGPTAGQASRKHATGQAAPLGTGWWRVVGIRHSAITYAESGRQAIRKVLRSKLVGGWESPTAFFIGKELPDVIGC